MNRIQAAGILQKALMDQGWDEGDAAFRVDELLGFNEPKQTPKQAEHVFHHQEPMQNSAKIRQSAKGDWYIEGITLYFSPSATTQDITVQLREYREAVERSLPGEEESC